MIAYANVNILSGVNLRIILQYQISLWFPLVSFVDNLCQNLLLKVKILF
jgi:hypothetical protein